MHAVSKTTAEIGSKMSYQVHSFWSSM